MWTEVVPCLCVQGRGGGCMAAWGTAISRGRALDATGQNSAQIGALWFFAFQLEDWLLNAGEGEGGKREQGMERGGGGR